MREPSFVRDYLRGFEARSITRDYGIALGAVILGCLLGYLFQLSPADSALTFMLPGETLFAYTAARQYFVGRRLTRRVRK